MKPLSLALFIIGVLIIAYSITLDPYTNNSEFEKKYMAIPWQSIGTTEASNQFYSLREEYLTIKYRLENYGLTAMVLAFFVYVFLKNGWDNFVAPKSKLNIILLGFLCACSYVAAYIVDLVIAVGRAEYPHWADSIGIPLMGVPFLFFYAFIWYILHLLPIWRNFQPGANISEIKIKKSNYWFIFLTALAIILNLFAIVTGAYLYLYGGVLWLYFYLSILAGKQRPLDTSFISN